MAIKHFFTSSNDFISRISRSMTDAHAHASEGTKKNSPGNRRSIYISHNLTGNLHPEHT